MKYVADAVRLPSADETIAPLTILDGAGRVVRVVSAAEFRRDHAPIVPARHPRQLKGPGRG